MSKISSNFDGIYRAICAGGETFTGGSAVEVAEAWAEFFTADEVERWVEAECWDVDTAYKLRSAGFRPGVDTLEIREGFANARTNEMDPMYALCNSDVSIRGVSW